MSGREKEGGETQEIETDPRGGGCLFIFLTAATI